MPAGDGPAQLLDESLRLGWHLAAQAGDGRKRERVDVRVFPAAQQARHDAQLRRGQSPVGSQFPLKPLHANSRTREQEHPVIVEQDQLVPPGDVQDQPGRLPGWSKNSVRVMAMAVMCSNVIVMRVTAVESA